MEKLVQVEMLTIAAGPNGNFQPGDAPWLTPEAAKLYVEGGYAKYVAPPAPQRGEKKTAETAAVEQPETTAKPAARKRTTKQQAKAEKKEEAE